MEANEILYLVFDETDGYEDLIYKGTSKDEAFQKEREWCDYLIESGIKEPQIKIRVKIYNLPN